MSISHRLLRAAPFALLLALPALAAPAPKPLKVLLITGGCCHDYAKQKDILKQGIEQRANVIVDQMHTPDKSTRPPLPCHTDANYGKGYDVIIHDQCAAGINEADIVRNVLQPHVDGIPAVALHCAMHSYRVVKDYARPQVTGSEGALWFDLLGLQSSGHGPQEPITVRIVGTNHPVMRGLDGWNTLKEELYNNVQPPAVFPAHRPLAVGHQTVRTKEGTPREAEAVVIWTNEFGRKKTRVFGTSLGHNNATVEAGWYLDLVTRGVLWSAGMLGPDGKPAKAYEAGKQP